MKADLEHDHYQAGALHGPQEDPKHLSQTVTVGSPFLLLCVFCHCQPGHVAWATKHDAEMSQQRVRVKLTSLIQTISTHTSIGTLTTKSKRHAESCSGLFMSLTFRQDTY